MVGMSSVLFALNVVVSHGWETYSRRVFGIIQVPSRYAVWVEMILIQLIMPRASLAGHLGGILAGYAYVGIMDGSTLHPAGFRHIRDWIVGSVPRGIGITTSSSFMFLASLLVATGVRCGGQALAAPFYRLFPLAGTVCDFIALSGMACALLGRGDFGTTHGILVFFTAGSALVPAVRNVLEEYSRGFGSIKHGVVHTWRPVDDAISRVLSQVDPVSDFMMKESALFVLLGAVAVFLLASLMYTPTWQGQGIRLAPQPSLSYDTDLPGTSSSSSQQEVDPDFVRQARLTRFQEAPASSSRSRVASGVRRVR
eukprot:Rmarinus@m.7914